MTGWGILGTGLQAHRFAGDLAMIKGATLAAVCSRTTAGAEAAAKAMGAAQGVGGRASLLALPQVEVVYIATPTHLHKDDCLAALAAGKHVLCEKPLAMTQADAREIAAAAEAAGLFCMEALWTQFIPALAEADRLLAAGTVGAPRTLLASFGVPTRALGDPAPMPDGGALLDRGCYLISLALRLMGDVTAIDGHITPGPDGGDLSAAATLTFAGGRTAVLACSLTELLDNRLLIGATAGAIGLDDVTCPTLLTVKHASVPAAPSSTPSGLRESIRRAIRQSALLAGLKAMLSNRPRVIPCKGFGFVHEIEEVQACLASGLRQSAIHPLSRSIETLRIIEAIGRAGVRGAEG